MQAYELTCWFKFQNAWLLQTGCAQSARLLFAAPVRKQAGITDVTQPADFAGILQGLTLCQGAHASMRFLAECLSSIPARRKVAPCELRSVRGLAPRGLTLPLY
jgi:hypothetical protein